jgi:hypothetical protein
LIFKSVNGKENVMSIGSLGIIGGVSATPQTLRNASADRAATDNIRSQTAAANDQSAVDAAGIGKTEGDAETTSERDADGRLDWHHRSKQSETKTTSSTADASEPLKSRDLTGNSGGSLDLQG